MKAKYIIVNTQDRLPTESDQYYTDQGKIDFSNKNGNFWDENDEFELYPNWWLEEKEDHSEEMLSLLEKSRKMIQSLKLSMLVHPDCEEGSEFDDYTTSAQETENQIEELINKVKP
ncbi:hypothetical protein [Elizabethkingia anophelis]|uniref:hypothetical protein n=1 Tax=Elizabethkingia anophelis TaxID=1117645 RepID=UPI0016232D5E|nr:hypothetical protein [Elizabethkingia anophelis]MCT4321831.1 hypothetical protein [Elizabethkingia anophelis]